eukprot:gene43026-53396_t
MSGRASTADSRAYHGMMSGLATIQPPVNDYTFTVSPHEDGLRGFEENDTTPTEMSDTELNHSRDETIPADDMGVSLPPLNILEEALDELTLQMMEEMVDFALATLSLEVMTIEDEHEAAVLSHNTTVNSEPNEPPTIFIDTVDYSSLHLGDFVDLSVDIFDTRASSLKGSHVSDFSYLYSPTNESTHNHMFSSRAATSRLGDENEHFTFSPYGSQCSVSSMQVGGGVKSASIFTFRDSRSSSEDTQDVVPEGGIEEEEDDATEEVVPASVFDFSPLERPAFHSQHDDA